MNLYSYIVRYDSGFAPNPFYGYCTLATCKPLIREHAEIGDCVVGIGSASSKIRQGGRLVYAMKVSEIITHNEYFLDTRFSGKKPLLTGSRKQARGDNIYSNTGGIWSQADSFHSEKNGTPNPQHITKDTSVDKVLVGEEYIYFGKNGPLIPKELMSNNKTLCHKGRGSRKFSSSNFEDKKMIISFLAWLESLGHSGYVSKPYDWHDIQ